MTGQNCILVAQAKAYRDCMYKHRIIVLDRGCIVEYGPPGELLNEKKSVFHSMVKEAGLAT